MKKRMIALFLTFAMLLPLTPAVAADDTVPRPTVEEILSEYHQKAFEAEAAGETETASTYSRSGSSGKTLEQETVDTLNAAGYEAYNVTAENYDALEAQLKTDFADMGLDPNGSYIITISGEDTETVNAAPGIAPNVFVPVDPGGSGGFHYTYNGKTYTMRYVTVTAGTNSNLGCSSPINLLTEYGAIEMWKDLELPVTILSSLGLLPYTGTIYSLFSDTLLNTSPRQASTLTFKAGTNWTVTYTQIYNTQTQKWTMCGSIEYVKMRYFLDYTYYSSATNQYEEDDIEGTYGTVYSTLYNDKETMKQRAALAYERGSYWHDKVEYVIYSIDNETSISHYRWNEYTGYEPA